MSNNRNPYMNQNMTANTRNMNMRGGYGCQNVPQGQRSAQGDCGCAGNAGSLQSNYAQRTAQNDCGCAGSTTPAATNGCTQRSVQNDCGCAGNTTPAATGCTQRSVQNDCGCATPQRSVQNDCGCAGNAGYARIADMPAGDRASLLAYLDQVSFAAYEAALYLDTHPDCQSGLQYFRDHNEKRNLALKEYAKLYGPLTLKQADENCEAYWQWVNQPWPWEGGNC